MCEGGIADMAHVADMAGVEATLAARAAQTCLVDANPVQPDGVERGETGDGVVGTGGDGSAVNGKCSRAGQG